MKQTIKILIVDDDESYREGLKGVLETEEYEAMTAQDGVAAISELQAKQYDLVLLDIEMPRVNGMEVLKNIKNNYLESL